MRWTAVLLAAALALTGGGIGTDRLAADEAARADGGEFHYAAKVSCSLEGDFQDGTLVEGDHGTAVNLYNPTGDRIGLTYTVALARPASPPPGAVDDPIPAPQPREAEIGPGEALVIDCAGVAALFCPVYGTLCIELTEVEGFVVLRSPIELDVVAVYRARTAEGQVRALDVEAVAPRRSGVE
jgi:hypothetical protein